MPNKNMEYYDDAPVADEEIEEFMNEEIERAPKAPHELEERLREHHSTSPADSGGDIDAEWEDANDSGAESVGGHNPTPDQSDTEENAHAMGINFEDNEPLDLLEKREKRDRDRYEMQEGSKGRSNSI
jgi:hypothetical protein